MKKNIIILLLITCGCASKKILPQPQVTSIEPRTSISQYVSPADSGNHGLYTLYTSVLLEWGEKSPYISVFSNNTLWVYQSVITGSYKFIKDNKALEYRKYDSLRLYGVKMKSLCDSISSVQINSKLKLDSLNELNKL